MQLLLVATDRLTVHSSTMVSAKLLDGDKTGDIHVGWTDGQNFRYISHLASNLKMERWTDAQDGRPTGTGLKWSVTIREMDPSQASYPGSSAAPSTAAVAVAAAAVATAAPAVVAIVVGATAQVAIMKPTVDG